MLLQTENQLDIPVTCPASTRTRIVGSLDESGFPQPESQMISTSLQLAGIEPACSRRRQLHCAIIPFLLLY
jgi:hypothetical protein